MVSVIDKLKTGDFNTMESKWLPDGSLEVILTKRGDPARYRMKVRDLYGENEEVLDEEIIEA